MIINMIVLRILGVATWLMDRRQNAKKLKPVSVCESCSYSHIQYSTKGRRTTSCTYGGRVRPIKVDVLYCTDYNSKTAEVRESRIGYVLAKSLADPKAAAVAVQSEK